MLFPWYIKYPNQNDEILNLDWILSTIDNLVNEVANFVSLNTIKYADPIQWNITTQYEKNTVVIDPITGSAYISTKPVPAGVGLNNEDYWNIIFTLDVISANKNITLRDDANNILATFESEVDDWLLWQGTLYIVTRSIEIGQSYVVGYNIDRYTVERFLKDYITNLKSYVDTTIGDLTDLDTTVKTDVVAAINSLLLDVSTLIGDLAELDTTDKDSVVEAINELVGIISDIRDDIGTLSDLDTEVKTSLVAAINEVASYCGTLSELKTTDKTSLTGAINELYDSITSLADVGYVTPEDFGAIGDGVTDDSAAINAAIASKKPVKFIHNYAIASPIQVNPTDSPFIDGQGFIITALSGMTGYMMRVNKLYGVIKNIKLNGSLLTTLDGALLIYSTNSYQAQFILFDNIYIINAQVGIQYGDGTTNAQSENTIHGYRTRSVIVPLDINQPNGMLWVTDSHLDATPYEWVSSGITPTVTPFVINQHIGGLCIDNCTLESPSYSDRSMILYDAIVTNCIVEIAGVNIQIINYGTSFRSELTFENCRFYESQGSSFITVGGGNTDCKLTLKDCTIFGSSGALIYATIKQDVILDNVKTSKYIEGANINILEVNNIEYNGYRYPLQKMQYSGVKNIKGTKQYIGSVKVTHTANSSIVFAYCSNGGVAGSETVGTVYGSGEHYFAFNKYNANEVLNIGVTNGTLEVTMFTVNDGQGFQAAATPGSLYPNGTLVADSTGATAGWVVSNGHVKAI